MFKHKIYAPNIPEWEKQCNNDYFDPHTPVCKEYENAYILPVLPDGRRNINVQQGFTGGVCDQDGNFVAGLTRIIDHKTNKPGKMAFTVTDAYPFDKNSAEYIDEEFIYCGIAIPWFGHMISDSMVFMWYAVKNLDKSCRFVFLSAGNCPPPEVFYKLMEALGITRERILIVDKIYKFRKIYVPEQSFYHHGRYTDEMLTAYDVAAQNAIREHKGEKYKKVYFTRSAIKDNTGFNEDYFENFYRKRGYTIIAPETLPLKEQITILSSAEEIVCLYGTLTMSLAFSKNLKKITILLRVNDPGSAPFTRILQARQPECSIVDISMAPLPTTLANGRYYVGPTPYWKQYLDSEGIPYDDEEVKMDWSYLLDYMQEYAKTYSNFGSLSYMRVKNTDFFDLISRMALVFNGDQLDRNEADSRTKNDLNNEIALLRSQPDRLPPPDPNTEMYKQAYKELQELKSSNTYRWVMRLRKIGNSRLGSFLKRMFRRSDNDQKK